MNPTTRNRRNARELLEQECEAAARRIAVAAWAAERAAREAAGAPVIDPADLRVALRVDLADAARQLAALTPRQLARQAVAYAAYLSERRGVVVDSADVFINFEKGIAQYGKGE
jgi:hypothetical protein